jgi:hypothetical protein
MRTTKKELLEMIQNIDDDTEIVLQVRGNKSSDYGKDERIIAFENRNGVLIIMDMLSK